MALNIRNMALSIRDMAQSMIVMVLSMIDMALGMTNMDLIITDMALSIVKGIMAQSMMTRNMIHMALIRGKATLLNMTKAMTLPIHMAQQLHHIK